MIATDLWKSSGGTQTYIGDWHTHPMGGATPSGMDRNSWQSAARRGEYPLLFVVVSPEGWQAFVAGPPQLVIRRLYKAQTGLKGLVFR